MRPANMNKEINTDDTVTEVFFKKGEYDHSYVLVKVTGLPNGVRLNLIDENLNQLYTQDNVPCFITSGQLDAINLPKNNTTNGDFDVGTYNWNLKFDGNNYCNSITIPFTVKIKDFEIWKFLTPSIFPNEKLQIQYRTYIDTIPQNITSIQMGSDNFNFNIGNGIAENEEYYEVGTHTGTVKTYINNTLIDSRNIEFEIKNPTYFWVYNFPTEYVTNKNVGLGWGISGGCSLRSVSYTLLLNNNPIPFTSNATSGGSSYAIYKYYSSKNFIPNTYYFTAVNELNDGKTYTCDAKRIVSTINCSIDLSYNKNINTLTSKYYHSTQGNIQKALMGLIDANTNTLISTGTTNSNGEILWNITYQGTYKVVAINVDNEYILSSENITITEGYPVLTNITFSSGILTTHYISSISNFSNQNLVTDIELTNNGISMTKEKYSRGNDFTDVIKNVTLKNDVILEITK